MENRSRMRFLLEFVSCCATPRHTLESSNPGEDQERWLVLAPAISTSSASISSRYRYHRKQRKGALDWRPSLGSISEDIDVPPKSVVPPKSAVREVKKKTVARGRPTKVYHRSYSDGYYGSVKKLTVLRLI
ncbi:hypothetical protein TSUD_94270 [Trifolium subterraneum]|uniref:Uncharacterized protein n=1 Tax=Trifolium subterraneum TaxID=3900 RepID=A0A2Z6P253_TRISU|nr:hypothetical protein TSUD_94270 [Trifolium subterraneum]